MSAIAPSAGRGTDIFPWAIAYIVFIPWKLERMNNVCVELRDGSIGKKI